MLTNIPSATLRQLIKLSERKDALLSQVQKIDREIVAIQRRATSAGQVQKAPVTVSRRPRTMGSRAKRGALKAKIMKALRAAGKRGVTIRELAGKLRTPTANLYVWFNGTGRNVRGLKKIGPAKYRLGR